MKRSATLFLSVMLLMSLLAFVSCSKQSPKQPSAPSQGAAQSAAPPTPAPSQSAQPAAAPAATQPAPAAPATGKLGGPAATEKHLLVLTEYGHTAVTVTLNGQWVGQWDSNTQAPLDSVIQGKNQLDVELQDTPKTVLQVEIFAQRAGQNVNLLRLNFQDKPKGTYTYNFGAR